ncbi:MAG: nucleotidyltransferase domain-containing protein [Eubacteriaceae bacterium]|nr:nucleotidyltransferase domain-containing protein [Eubacteriaceae bacterium]
MRPVLACRWILEKQTPPPMLFSELAAAELPAEIKTILKNIDDKVTFDWNHLNRIFLEEIRKYK